MPRVIAHIDMDAFFASVEQRDNPVLKGQPVVVGADPKGGRGRGVVSTCSYEARPFGIHSAQPISTAYKLCPHAVFLPVDFKKYNQASEEIFTILNNFTPDIEPISIDEAFLDLTGSYHFYKTPFATAQAIKEEIKKKVRLTASIGIAPVKMVAKIASDFSKPDGLLEITEEKLLDFLWPLPIRRLWGVGPKTQEQLNRMGIKTVGDIARLSPQAMYEKFGESGAHLHELANGIDPRAVESHEEAKSVSHEHTFDVDCADPEVIYKVMLVLSEKVSRRLRKSDLAGKTLSLKIRLKGFKTYSRAFTFDQRTNHTDSIYTKAKEIFTSFYKRGMEIRLIGVRMTNFDSPYLQEILFDDGRRQKSEKIHSVMDTIKDRFGEGAIHRAI